MDRKVVITGLGVVSAAGVGADAAWGALESGGCRIGPIGAFDASGFPCRLAGEASGLAVKDYVPKAYRKFVKVMARDTEIAVAAAQLAAFDAGVATRGSGQTGEATTPEDAFALDLARTGCQIGAGLLTADLDELTLALATSTTEGRFDPAKWGSGEGGAAAMNNLPPLWMLKYLPNMLACHVTIIHGTEGPSNTITCAESSGILSIGEGARVIERGDADACFSGGAESKLNPMGLLRLTVAGRLAPTGGAQSGEALAMPYDERSAGGLPGEGGAILMLEEAQHAARRGAKVYAHVAGFGAAHSAGAFLPGIFEDSRPEVDNGVERAVRAALRDAGVGPDEVDAIVPGGLGVADVDAAEARALRAVFGDRLADIETITVAPALGNTSAGHGALLTAVAARAIHERRLPARLHAGEAPTPGGLRAGRADAKDAPLHTVLVCTPSLGGQVGALVLRGNAS